MIKKSLLLTLLLALFVPWAANAYNHQVQVGNGTSGQNLAPINLYYNYSYTQQIYTAAQINGDCSLPGTIESISFYYAGSVTKTHPITVFMKTTEKTSFSGNSDWETVTESDIVYNDSWTVSTAGWVTITLNEPFAYDGESNLLIAIDKGYGDSYSNQNFRYTAVTNNQVIQYRNDSTDPDPYSPTTASGTSKNLPNILFNMTINHPAPSALTLDEVVINTATISWTAPQTSNTITGYAYEYTDGETIETGTVTGTTANLSELTAATDYLFQVKAVYSDGESCWSEALEFTTMEACMTPENLTISDVTAHTATLTWTEGFGDGQWVLQYKLSTDEEYTNSVEVALADLPYTLTGLTAESTYNVLIAPVCDATKTLTDNFTTTVACFAPTNLAVEANVQTATFTWESDVNDYEIAHATVATADPNDNIVGTATENTYSMSNLTIDANHYFWVRSNCGSEGYSSWAGPASVHIGYCIPNPTSHDGKGITGVSFGIGDYIVTNGDGSASLPASAPFYGNYSSMIGAVQAGVESTIAITTSTGSFPYTFVIWVDFDNSLSFEDSEVVYVGKASSGSGTLNATITIPATQELGDYRMRIYGADSYFTSFYNNGNPDYTKPHDPCSSGSYRHAHDYTLRVLEAPSCFAPTGLTASDVTAHNATISWTSDAEAWEIQLDDEEAIEVTEATYTFTGLTAETEYSVKVRTNCSGTYSDWTSAINFTTGIACPAPTSVTVSNITGHTATVTWDAEAGDVFEYALILANVKDNTKEVPGYEFQQVQEYPLTLNGLDPETQYKLYLRKDCGSVDGYSQIVTKTFTTDVACPAPTALEVTSDALTATFTWESGASSWDVTYGTDANANPDECMSTTVDEATYTVNDLELGDYYFWVRANCGVDDGNSEWAGPASVHIGYCIPNPTSHDGKGITGVSFGTGDYVVTNGDGSASLPASAPYYGDYSSMIGAVQAGVESTIAITTATSGSYSDYPYTFVIWVDLDNSLSFEDSEILYIGKAPQGNGTFNATITVPATQALGDYRMRIYGADSYFTNFYNNGNTNWNADHDPCSSGTYRHAHDYTLRVLEAPSCLAAGDVTVDPETITSTSAVITWTNNNGTDATYTVMQGETVLTTTAVDSYTLEGLTAATTYPAGTFTIISDCDETTVANVPEFATLCDDITTLPWSEDFEGFENNTVPMCWDNSASTSSISSSSSSPNCIWGVVTVSDNKMMKMENYWASAGTALINTPTIVLPAEGTYMLSFDYAHNASCGAFAVNVSTDNGATFTELASYTKGSGSSHTEPGDFTPATISLADYAGESIILQFFANANYGNGAIFVDNIKIQQFFTMEITGYGNSTGGYHLIASPVVEDVTPSVENGFLTDAFDLYYFDQTEHGAEWRNYEADEFSLTNGKGYLYASQETTTLTFVGTPYSGDSYEMPLVYDNDAIFKGWNLVGNPFTCMTYVDLSFYTLDDTGSEVIPVTDNTIEVMQGIFVVAEADGDSVTFTTTAPEPSAKLTLNLSQGRGFIDRAIVRFDEGHQLPKIQLNPNHTKVYIPMDGKDYAVVNAEEMGEMPVSFKAETNGTYNLSFTTEEVSFNYLHLLDNMTGADVDLLETPSYTFEARSTDFANRFKLVFATGTLSVSENFAFFNNGNLLINNEGEATVQVIDINGRILSSETINGSANINVNGAAGVYMIRLINGENVRVQKVVVR